MLDLHPNGDRQFSGSHIFHCHLTDREPPTFNIYDFDFNRIAIDLVHGKLGGAWDIAWIMLGQCLLCRLKFR